MSTVCLRLTKSGKEPVDCPIGAPYGTGAITVPPMSTTVFVISREPVPSNEYVNIVVSGLGDIISTIPDEIVFDNVNCTARQVPVTFELGTNNTFNAIYDAIIPPCVRLRDGTTLYPRRRRLGQRPGEI